MSETILVPFDGSELATHALTYAAAMARASRGRLVLTYAPAPWELPFDAPARLHATASRLQASGLEVTAHVAPPRPGNPGRALLATARQLGAGVIVLGTHAYGTVGRALFGSIADYLVRHTPVPVLLCTAQADRPWPENRPRRLLVPLDGSAIAETALPAARRIARSLGASIDLVGVVDLATVAVVPGSVQLDAFLQSLGAETRRYLERVATDLRQEAIIVDVQVRLGLPERVIADLADELLTDIIVMATHGRGGVGRLLVGSVALRTVQRSAAPVLLVPPAAAAQGTAAAPLVAGTEAETVGESIHLAVTSAELALLRRGLDLLGRSPEADQRTRNGVAQILARLPEGPVPG